VNISNVNNPNLTRAEVYQLAVYWSAYPTNNVTAQLRLKAIGQALGPHLLRDAMHDAADVAGFGHDNGYLLDQPWIEHPDDWCPEFRPTIEERRVLADLYRQVAANLTAQADALRATQLRMAEEERASR
jgi:hypothetical protein